MAILKSRVIIKGFQHVEENLVNEKAWRSLNQHGRAMLLCKKFTWLQPSGQDDQEWRINSNTIKIGIKEAKIEIVGDGNVGGDEMHQEGRKSSRQKIVDKQY